MIEQQAKITNICDPQLWRRFRDIARPYWFSEQKWQAWFQLALTLLLLFGINISGVKMATIGGKMSTALQARDIQAFWHYFYLTFLIIVPVILTGNLFNYFSRKLSLEWELWLTGRYLDRYFDHRAYFHINSNKEIDNPDQRLCSSVGSFTGICLGFVQIFFYEISAFLSYSALLWSISGKLCLFAVGYAVLSTVVANFFGKYLVDLNFREKQKSADFRYCLVQIRDNVESIAFYRGEEREKSRVTAGFLDLISVLKLLIGWQRNVDFFNKGYNQIAFFIPFLVLAPLFLSGKLPYGDIGVAAGAFAQVLSSLSVVADNISAFTWIATEVNRLDTFDSALEQAAKTEFPADAALIRSEEGSGIALDNVTLQTPDYSHTLLKGVTAEVLPGSGLLIAGASGVGKSSVLRAIAGLWSAGAGTIIRPPLREMFFLPQRPYIILGSLREQLLYPELDKETPLEELQAMLEKVNLGDMAERFGGFDMIMDWENMLSPGEQQRLAFARLLLARPRYAVLDEATSALDVKNEAHLYRQLKESGTTFISVGHRPGLLDYHDKVLELQGAGGWRVMAADEFRIAASA